MELTDNPGLRARIDALIERYGEDAMSWTEIHGLLCAVSAGPGHPEGWQQMVLGDAGPVDDDTVAALHALQQRVATQLGAGDRIQLPCRLDPYSEDDNGNDLGGWCAGFMTGVLLQEDAWYAQDEERAANLLLPFVLISGFDDDDPDLDALWQDTKVVRGMAMALPELLEELFLFFNAPDAPDQGDEGSDED
ncbi:YecA family protein [Isoalcanivorax indicus]|uniref:YecA/YgfB family protein n=1 Tax=Isoalcanivorax indicus TaxID=2202653 RepID=UPI000DBA0874|nr:YecA family protein [Isoalcanivorax indicus]